MQKIREQVSHKDVPPLIDKNSSVLLLGSMPPPSSRQAKFYYAHPQNRFWQVMFSLFNTPYSANIYDRKALATVNHFALWDVIDSCTIIGSADSTIDNAQYTDVIGLLTRFPNIKAIFTTGTAAHKHLQIYAKSHKNDVIDNAIRLPSTSGLNCAYTLDDLIKEYSIVLDFI